MLALGVDHDRKDRDFLTCPKDSLDRVGEQELADALPSDLFVARESADQGGGDESVPWQLLRDGLRDFGDGQREGAQAVEPNEPQRRVDRDEDPRDVALLVLPGSALEPVVEIGFPATELSPVVPAERLDDEGQGHFSR